MIRITQLRLSIHHTEQELKNKIIKTLRIDPKALESYQIARRSLDARDKGNIIYSYTVDVALAKGAKTGRKVDGREIMYYEPREYRIHAVSQQNSGRVPPVIVGCGPAGLFAGLALARAGLEPLILERGEDAVSRKRRVEHFWETGELDTSSNVCFGEGGAGTFSDGKLNTLVKDPDGRHGAVLKTFAEFGADPSIMYDQKPHIGTDRLIEIITAMRREIERLGGRVCFNAEVTDLAIDENGIREVIIKRHIRPDAAGCPGKGKDEDHIETDRIACRELILAIGHSARDTFSVLKDRGLYMQPKAFAVGLRIQHPQHMIDVSQFGEKEADFLSPAAYKLTGRARDGRGVYTFCMCPGGYVVNASTEQGMLTVNGMSYSGRDSGTANSALIVTVTPEDFAAYAELAAKRGYPDHVRPESSSHHEISQTDDPLLGIYFQRSLERAAFNECGGKIPVQLLGDYLAGRPSTGFGETAAKFKGACGFGRLDTAFPSFIKESIADVMPEFGRKIKGFDREDAILAGIEGRTSSPVRIVRNENGLSNIQGIYPCGEGAGYAGGITSAAMDGLLAAERIIEKYL
jgi:uncharacterized protein